MIQFVAKMLVLTALVISNNAFAAGEKVYSVKELVDQYYQMKEIRQSMSRIISAKPTSVPRYCPPSGPSCLDAVCDSLGRFGCDDASEVREVAESCRGNYDGSCVTAVCNKLGRFGCDDLREVKPVARACVGNIDSSCFESVCKRLGSFGCDDLREVEEVLRACAGN